MRKWNRAPAAILAAAILAITLCASATEPAAICPLARPRPQDRIWLVSTRELGFAGCRLAAPPDLAIWQYDADKIAWRPSSVGSFLKADDTETPTNVFVHGNWHTFEDSIYAAFNYYRYQAAAAPSERPLRLVIWSWPSTRGKRPLRDVRAKYARTDTEGEYLAWFLGRVSPKAKVSLVGYSFGSAIVTGALHRLGEYGGALAGEPVPEIQRTPKRAVLFAAAEDEYVLSSGGEHALALSQVDRLLNLTNTCDPALKWFRFVDRCNRPEALGYRGIAVLPKSQAHKVEQVACENIVGAEHYWMPYVASPELIARMRPYIWFTEPTAGAP